jgi:hypothetical protein
MSRKTLTVEDIINNEDSSSDDEEFFTSEQKTQIAQRELLKANTVKDKILTADSSESSSDEAFEDVKARVEKEKKLTRPATLAPQHFSKNVAEIMQGGSKKKTAFSSDSDSSSDDSAFDMTENQRKKVLEDSDDDSDNNDMQFDKEIKAKTLLYTRKETIKAKKTT